MSTRKLGAGRIAQRLLAIPVRLLRPIVIVRLVRFHTAFGFVLRSPLYYSLRREVEQAQREQRFFDIVFYWADAPDRKLTRIWAREFCLVQRPISAVVSRALNVVAWYWERQSSMKLHVLDFTKLSANESERMNSKTFSAHNLMRPREIRDVRKCLDELGLSADSRIALLHVRNEAHDAASSSANRGYATCASTNASVFQQAVDYLMNYGFSVVTIGNHPASASDLSGVIEYHSSTSRTPLRDFTLGSIAELYLGTAAGAMSGVAFNFRLPALLTNYLIWSSNWTAEPLAYGRAVFLPKNVRRDGQYLTHSQMLTESLPISDIGLQQLNVEVEDNSAADILEALKYLLRMGHDEAKWNLERSRSEQRLFWKVFDEHTRLRRICANDGAVIGLEFLKKYPHWFQ